MRKLRLLSMAAVLALTLAVPAFAGITNTPPAPEPPPPPSSATATATGITETPPAAQSEPTDPVIEFALNLLQSVLMAF